MKGQIYARSQTGVEYINMITSEKNPLKKVYTFVAKNAQSVCAFVVTYFIVERFSVDV